MTGQKPRVLAELAKKEAPREPIPRGLSALSRIDDIADEGTAHPRENSQRGNFAKTARSLGPKPRH